MKTQRTLKGHVLAATVALGAVALVGCPAPGTNPGTSPSPGSSTSPISTDTTNTDAQSDATTILSDLSDFETSLTQASAELSAASDTGAGATIQSLGDRQVQDVASGSTYDFTQIPTAFPDLTTALNSTGSVTVLTGPMATTSLTYNGWTAIGASASNVPTMAGFIPNWIKNNYPKITAASGSIGGRVVTGSSTESYYVATNATNGFGPYAYYQIATHDGLTVSESFAMPDSWASGSLTAVLPAPFNTIAFGGIGQPASVPSSLVVRKAATTWFTYGSQGSKASGWRFAVHDGTRTGRPLWAWCKSMTINRPAGAKSLPQTINHYDMATNYKGNPRGGTTPYEQITDDRNVTAKTWYHQDKIYDDVTDPNNPVWNSNGSYTDAKGNTRQTQESWNTATNVRTRTVKWRTAKGVNMVLVTTFQRDRSGTGTMSANGNQIGTLTWGTNGKGTMTVGGSVTSNITMHY